MYTLGPINYGPPGYHIIPYELHLPSLLLL